MGEDDLVLGLDAGTQSVKAGLWTLDGRHVALGSRPLQVSSPREGWAEQDPEDWWTAASGAIRDCRSRAGGRVRAVGMAWQRETFCLTDERHEALRPAILWLDVRAHAEASALSQGPEAAAIHELTGVPPDVTTVLPRLEWLRAREPALFKGRWLWEDVGAWLSRRLTGRRATCAAGADTTGLLELRGGSWCSRVLDHAGLAAADLPDLVESGDIVGKLLPETAAELGLEAGIPVVAAGGDGQVFAAACAAATREGGHTLSLGTSVVLGVGAARAPVSPMYRTLRAAWPGGGHLLEAVLQSGSYLFRWLVDRLAPRAGGLEELERLGAPIGPGSEGLLTVPHWWGSRFPHPAPDARGSSLGWSDRHTAAHLYRSLLEGSAFEIRLLRESIPEAAASADRPLVVGGGGAASALWPTVLAGVLGCDIHRAPAEPVAAGAALLAALGAGLADPAVLAPRLVAASPVPGASDRDRELYDRLYREVWLPYRAVSVEHTTRLGRLTHDAS